MIEDKETLELIQSLVAESAKAANEVRCAQRDLDKIKNRLNFSLVVLNELINREQD